MTQSKTIYGIEQYMTLEGMPEARGKIHKLKTDSIPGILDTYDFQSVTIYLPGKLMAFFPTEAAANRHLNESAAEVGSSYLSKFEFDEEA